MTSHDTSGMCSADCLLLECDCAKHSDIVHAGQTAAIQGTDALKAPQEAWGEGVHSQVIMRAVDVFPWSLPVTAERSVQDMLQGAMADALQRQQVQMGMDSAVKILSTADTAAASDLP